MNKRIITILFFSICTLCSFAQSVSFRASAPSAVAKGQQFRLSYTLSNAEGSDLKVPETIKGFDVLYGPSVSSSSETTVINGKVSSNSSVTYIYILQAKTEGTFSLPAASIKVGGRTLTSNALQVHVLPPDKNAQARQQQAPQSAEPVTSSSSSTPRSISPNDAFIRAIITKAKVHEQEAFLVTFRFYTRLSVQDIGKVQFPEFEGFMSEEVDMPANQQLKVEHYNGQNYYAVDLKKTVLFPQRSGNLVIPQGKIEMVFQVPSGVRTFFGEEMAAVKKTITTKPINVHVEALPLPKPADYSSGVGNFSLNTSITSKHVRANTAVTMKVVISGTGNTKLIKNPEFEFPNEFETYDPKVTQNVKVTENGLSGSKTIEYLFIPRYEGNYKIPAVTMSYFDTRSNSYKTLKIPEYSLKVDKDPNGNGGGSSNYGTQKEVLAQQDIHYLNTDPYLFKDTNDILFGSLPYYLWYILPAIIFLGFSIAYRKQIRENSNIALVKTKKANKVASKRLKLAKKYLQSQNKSGFYEEILRAVWGYMSDKLSIPVANLNRDNIDIELTSYGADDALKKDFLHILDTSEFARYAPAESADAMDKLYDLTVEAIGKMENVVKARKK